MRKLGKRDVMLIMVLLFFCFAAFFIRKLAGGTEGAYVLVTVDGEIFGEYPLCEEREVPIKIAGETVNRLKIGGGAADMIWADCPDKLCVRQKPVSKENETIVCLPHRVVVTVEGAAENGFDSIAR